MGKEEGTLLDPMTTARVYAAGVDVSKDRLDVCVRRSEPERHGGGDAFVVAHDDAGIDTLVSRLVEKRSVLVIVEATGGFERAVVGGFDCSGIAGSGG
jgi:transposase